MRIYKYTANYFGDRPQVAVIKHRNLRATYTVEQIEGRDR